MSCVVLCTTIWRLLWWSILFWLLARLLHIHSTQTSVCQALGIPTCNPIHWPNPVNCKSSLSGFVQEMTYFSPIDSMSWMALLKLNGFVSAPWIVSSFLNIWYGEILKQVRWQRPCKNIPANGSELEFCVFVYLVWTAFSDVNISRSAQYNRAIPEITRSRPENSTVQICAPQESDHDPYIYF